MSNFQVKMYKTHQLWTTFGGSDVEKVDAVVNFQVKMYKTDQLWTTFGGSDVEKVHAVEAQKHISKSKCIKHTMFGSDHLEFEISKKCTPLWHEAHFQVKSVKK